MPPATEPTDPAAPLLAAVRTLDLTSADGRAGIRALLAELDRLAPGAVLHNAHDDFRMSGAEFLSLLGVGRAGRTEIVQTLTSGATAVLRKRTAYGGEILLVVQTDGGCVTGVTSSYD